MARFSYIFITCLIALAQLADSDSILHSDLDNIDEFVDDVTLLQASAEVKKKEAAASKAKELQKPTVGKVERYPELPRDECSPTDSILIPAEVPAGESSRKNVQVETPPEMERIEVTSNVEVSSELTDAVVETDAVPTSFASSLAWQIVVVAVCGLFFTALKAARSADNLASEAAAVKHRVTDSVHKETWRMLLDSALAADEASFEEAFKHLSEEGMVNIDSWGCTALHFAAKGGSVPIVKRFLEHGLWVDSEDAWDETPLHIAARAGHLEVCQFLLLSGAGIDTLNAEDRTPLVVAGWAKHADVCRFLLAEGAGIGGMPADEVPPMVSEMLALQALQDQNK